MPNGVVFRPKGMGDEEWLCYKTLKHPDGEEYPGQFDPQRRTLNEKYGHNFKLTGRG